MSDEPEISEEHAAFLRDLEKTDPKLYRAVAPNEWLPAFWEACLHEAAHAVVMHAYGERIDRVRCKGHEGGVTPHSARSASVTPFHVVVCLLAGVLAEPDGEVLAVANWRDIIDDVLNARRIEQTDYVNSIIIARGELEDSNDADAILAIVLAARARAIDLLQTPQIWAAILGVAQCLRIEEALPGERVHEICAAHVPFGAFND
ncbi:hypothetical protein J2Y63_005395 [Shinella sp. BE166]|uniref:hypothetical protein n=1 Tax=Shinella sp. BE166 TaxID=3373918 RepID=UPI003EBBC365